MAGRTRPPDDHPRAVVVADDLTGAADTGAQFARAGLPTRVWLGRNPPPSHGAVVFDADTRSLPPAAAARRVARIGRALRAHPDALVYKKIDSTLRGNVGAETEALLRALGRRLAVVAPAFPANNRTTRAGVQLVAGVPVHQTAAAEDPAHPMPHPTIAAALRAQSELPVVNVGLEEVRGDLAGALAQAVSRGPAFAVVDAETDDDLAAIGRALARIGRDALPVGSAGLAAHLPLPLGEDGRRPREGVAPRRPGTPSPYPLPAGEEAASKRPLLVCGSLNPATLAQVASLPVPPLDPFERHLELPRDGPILLSTAARRLDLAAPAVARRLARRVARLVAQAEPDALVLTGGDVARAVLDALGVDGVELVDEILPGMPVGRAIGGRVDGWPVVTKAGGFGPPDALAAALRYLQAPDQRSGED